MLAHLRSVLMILVMVAGLPACSSYVIDAQPVAGAEMAAPGSPESPFRLGKAHLAAGNLGLALSHFRKADAETPDDLHILNALGVTYDRLGRFDISHRYYLRALAIDPASPQTLNNMGYSLLLAHRYQEAAATLLAAYEKGRDGPFETTIASNLLMLRENAVAAVSTGNQPVKATSGVLQVVPNPMRTAEIVRSGNSQYTLATGPASLRVASTREIRQAHQLIRAAPVIPVSARHLEEPARQHSSDPWPVVEVCNGAGRRALAARIGRHLGERGVPVKYRTNDVRFDRQATVILFRSGHRSGAQRIARLLPFATELQEVAELVADVKIRLGGDSLGFDEALIRKYRAAADRQQDRGEKS